MRTGPKIGNIPWNKGKTKLDFPQMANSGHKKGSGPWLNRK